MGGIGEDVTLKYYNMPGRILAELWFLWSKKGEIWGSARRRNHPFVHFFYSTMIYAIAAFVAYLAITDWKMPRREKQSEAEYLAASDTSYSEAESSLEEQAVPVEDEPEPERADAEDASVVADDLKTEGATSKSSGSSGEIKSAMTSAFETGQPVRWEAAGAKGYAVPSEAEASSGCRQVHYSEDDRPGWTSSPETICP